MIRRERLAASASGLRHLRWAREILGTLEAHYEHDPRVVGADRDALLEEAVKLRALIQALSSAVKGYRDFLERDRTRFRGMLRVGRYLVREARDAEERAEAEAIQEGLGEAFATMEARERAPRRQAVREAVSELREGLLSMDGRIAIRMGEAFGESLYPELASDGTRVLDDGDGDDDAAGA